MKVLLLSGGMDSALILAQEHESIDLAMTFSYGQPHDQEIKAAKNLAKLFGVEWELCDLSSMFSKNTTGLLGGSDLTPEGSFVRARNFSFVIAACARGATEVLLGANLSDQSAYPDCRPGALASLEKSLSEAGSPCAITLPLSETPKSEVIKAYSALQLEATTVSCYRGNRCGICPPCNEIGAAQ